MKQHLKDSITRCGIALLVYFLYRLLIPLVPINSGLFIFASIISSLLFMCLTIWLIKQFVELSTEIWIEIVVAVLCAVCMYSIQFMPLPVIRKVALFKLGIPAVLAVRDLLLMIAVSLLGKLVSRLFKETAILPPAALFAAIADIVIVRFWLPVYMKHSPLKLSQVGMSVPIAGSAATTGHVAVMGLIGPADFMFIAVFLACCYRFHLQTLKTAVWTAIVLASFLVLQFKLARILPVLAMLPGLVPIALTFLIVNRKQFQLSCDEWRSVGIASIIVAVIITILIIFER